MDGLARGPGWLAARPWPLRLAVLSGVGGLAGLGQIPTAWPVATLLALVAAMDMARRRAAGFAEGWALGVGYFAFTLRWIVDPFLVEPERTGWMAPFALFFMAAGLALFWGLAFGLARRLRLGLWGLVPIWTGVEVLRSLVLTGFPWVLLGHVWSETPLIQLASVIGVHGMTLLTLATAAVLASPGAGYWRAAVPAALVAAAVLLRPGPPPALDPEAPVIRIVQPNVPQEDKWNPDLMPGHLQRLLTLSGPPEPEGAGPQRPASLVVWPETALADLLEWAGPVLEAGARVDGGVPVATGVVRRDEQGRFFNSLVVTDDRGNVTDLYDKVHLVPFGEYIPFRGRLDELGLEGLAEMQGDGFTAGEPSGKLIDIPGIGSARALICYEGIFPEEIGSGSRPRLLLLVTNDAWFGDRAGPEQHFALGRLRAIEFGLPLVRAANTGISAMIDGKGRILASLPLHEAGALDVPLPPALPPTIYARLGDGPVLLVLAMLTIVAFRRRGIDPAVRGA
ncbi:apolipoprotein N-acyltransferase [Rubellimicrobium arenae]|uniref:apolipoprotein N-acyltransferase n=1 Tax=Rubellimicrobium arenae TaxID=2817372 RepID=UPI001B3106B6|nr:apolipoprotein N-acyltransferase [Rubellimicrobium arenae]